MQRTGGSVPIVISYRTVTQLPEIKRTRRFVGLADAVSRLVAAAWNFIDDVCYETESEVLEAGEQSVVHWALEVEEPWGMNDQSSLVAVRLPEKPACGASFEIIRFDDQGAPKVQEQAPPPMPAAQPSVEQERIRAVMRSRMGGNR